MTRFVPLCLGVLLAGLVVTRPASALVFSLFDAGIYHATLWSNGIAADLGSLCVGSCVISDSYAYAINDHGQVVGESYTAAGSGHSRGFLWQNGVMTELPPLAGDTQSAAYRINNDGTIVGYSSSYSRGLAP